MLFTADIGNTTISLGIFKGETLVLRSKIAAEPGKTVDEYALTLSGIFQLYGVPTQGFEGAVISSVVRPLNHTLQGAVQQLLGVTPIFVGPGVRTGLNIKIDSPGQLGADIAANCVAAMLLLPPPMVVLDLGTATTLTLMNRQGELCGVMICPGARSALNALSAAGAELPAISLEQPRALLGKNTIDSMNSGVVYGHAAMLDGLLQRIAAQLGEPHLPVVATGGLADVILPYCARKDVLIEPDLALLGLRQIHELNLTKSRKAFQ